MEFYSSHHGNDGNGRPSMSLADMIGEDGAVNKSFSSAISGASSASGGASSSSKAVLAALRALQDKIRRLETERSQALDEASTLRLQLKNQEIEHEHAKQRDQLSSQKSLQEARLSFERVSGEKAELEARLCKMDERNRALQQSSDELQVRIRHLEEDKHNTSGRLRDLENEQSTLEQQIRLAQSREKDAAETILWESRKHDEDLHALQSRVRHLQVELSEASNEKGAQDAKLIELDQLVAQLLSLNETLVAQLSGRPIKVPFLGSSGKKIKKKKVVEKAPPRAASVSTAATDAGKTTKFVSRSGSQLIPVKSDDMEALKAMHKLYASMAKSLKKGSPTKKRSDGRVATRMSKNHSRSASRDSERAFESEAHRAESPSTRSNASSVVSSASIRREVRLPKANVTFDASDSDHNDNGDASYLSHESGLRRSTLSDSKLTASANSAHTFSSSYSDSSPSKGMQDVVGSLEEEFDALNRQYRRLLSGVQASNNINDAGDVMTSDRVEAQAEEIVNVIQKLHQKGEQLRLLRNPARRT